MKTLVFVALIASSLALAGCTKDSAKETTSGTLRTLNPNLSKDGTSNGSGNGSGDGSGSSNIVGPNGNYFGYIQRADTTLVPLELQLSMRRNSGGTTSAPHVAIRVGVFGGVTIGTDTVTYEWDTGQLTAQFNDTNNLVTVTGFISQGSFSNASISGNQSGTQPVVLSKDGKSLFDENEEQNFKLSFTTNKTSAEMSVTTQFTGQTSNLYSDLSSIPLLGTAVRLDGLAVIPNNADSVLYDPLTGKMDVKYNNGGRLHFDGVALKSQNPEDVVLEGQIMAGSAIVDAVSGKVSSKSFTKTTSAPTVYYNGTLQGVSDFTKYPVAAMLEYRGSAGTNPAEDIFPSFPGMTLTVYVCGNNFAYGRMIFNLVQVNPVTGQFQLSETKDATQTINYSGNYTNNWQNLIGGIRSTRSTAGSTALNLSLKSVPAKSFAACVPAKK